MYQWKSNIVFKFSYREIYLNVVFEILVVIHLIEQVFGESSHHRLFVIAYYILEELINELDFKIGKIESSVVIRIELICQVEKYFVFFTLLFWIEELVD